MRRRDAIPLIGCAVAWPLAARAQQAAQLPTIEYLGIGAANANPELVPGFLQGLAEAGYVADRNVAIVGQMVTMGSYQTLPPIW